MKRSIGILVILLTSQSAVISQISLRNNSFGVGIHTVQNISPIINNAEHKRNYSLIPSSTGQSEFSPIYYKKGGSSIGIHAYFQKQIFPKWLAKAQIFTNYSGYSMKFNSLIARPMTNPNEPWIHTTEGYTLAGFQTLEVHHVFSGVELGTKYKLHSNKHRLFFVEGGVSFFGDIYPLNHLTFDTTLFYRDNKTDKINIRSNARRNYSLQIQPYIGFAFNYPLKQGAKGLNLSLRYSQLDMAKFYTHELFYFTAHNLKRITNFDPNFGRIQFGVSYQWNK